MKRWLRSRWHELRMSARQTLCEWFGHPPLEPTKDARIWRCPRCHVFIIGGRNGL